MGWAKYAEDNDEIIFERMDQMVNRESPYIEMMNAIPLRTCHVEISIEACFDEEHAEPKVRYENRSLYCRDCGKEFLFTACEQRFYENKGFHQPKRCKVCREKKQSSSIHFDKRR